MAAEKIVHLLLLTVMWSQATAQDQIEEICYGPESVVVAVIVTLIVTLGLLAAGLFLYRSYWKSHEDKHLMLVTDVENPNDQYAFDNPCFREATPIKHNLHSEEKQTSRLEKNKWLGWSPLNPFGKEQKPEKVTSLDDSYINDSRLKVVSLKSHDFTGLGFNICGNMRDGIFIKDVLHRGPAFESGCINAGDRIDSVCISFRNMVFEDALAILSYASPYDVQVQVENDSYSRPSTLIRSKRESNTISSTDRILHPKYSRSQSITHLNEIGKSNNKRVSHHVNYMHEKNHINHSLNRTHHHGDSNEYPTIKVTTPVGDPKKERQKLDKHAAPDHKKPLAGTDHQTKHQKFGIKVLPMNTSPKPGDGSLKTPKGPPKPPMVFQNEINAQREKPVNSSSVLNKKPTDVDEVDGTRENVKGMLAKSFQNLKEKINQNTLGRKKNKDPTENVTDGKDAESKTPKETMNGTATKLKELPNQKDNSIDISELDGPVSKNPTSASDGGDKNNEKTKTNNITIPEDVSKAGDVARNNRKSLNDPNSCRKSLTTMPSEPESENKIKSAAKKTDNLSDSENSTDGDSLKTPDEAKKPKRSKGKAPPPPAADMPQEGKITSSPKRSTIFLSNEINEIKKDPDNPSIASTDKGEKPGSADSEPRIISLKDDITTKIDENASHVPGYDSDSDVEPASVKPKTRPNNTKIELTSTQVTVHQSSSGDYNDDDIEPSRKAASLGDLSKLDSDQPLSIVLERAVSLDLADGGCQSGKKRKAPLPPSEEFPAVFDDLNYRKEPRLEHSLELNTFQRRLKKSSDFGTLEDALNEGPKSLEIEINRRTSPIDVTETHNSNIQEFSSWLAECRRPKSSFSETSGEDTIPSRVSSTSLVNINSSQEFDKETDSESKGNVSFSVNGKNFPIPCDQQSPSFSGTTSKTVVVISQPNSLEPGIVEAVPVNVINEDDKSTNHTVPKENQLESDMSSSTLTEQHEDTTLEPFVTAQESKFESFKEAVKLQEEDHRLVPKFPTSPIPVTSGSSTLSSPLSSSLTYITEIKVSTAEKNDRDSKSINETQPSSVLKLESNSVKTSTPKPEITNSISKRIQQFDVKHNSPKPLISPIKKSNFGFSDLKNDTTPVKRENHVSHESSKIPIKTMKSETGQKVLATIQSLATKDAAPTKIPEVEYAKRVASLFSGNSLERKQTNLKKRADNETTSQPNVSGFYLKGPETKYTKEINSVRKVPPTVPPRKLETSLSTRSSAEFEVKNRNESSGSVSGQSANEKTKANETQERNIVTFSSFVPKKQNEEQSNNSTLISFKIK